MEMEYESPHADELFTVDHIPGVPPVTVGHGDTLKPGGQQIATIFGSKADHVLPQRSLPLATNALRQAGYPWYRIPGKLWTLFQLTRAEAPHDREYFRARNPAARDFVEDFIGRFVAEESAVHGTENLAHAVERNAAGAPVLAFSNHASELDPVLLSILLGREQEKQAGGPGGLAAAAEEAREKLLAVIGHKVMLERFRRAFSGTVHSLFTVAAKYRDALPPGQKTAVSCYVDNVNTILHALVSHPEYFVLLFPEGGRTRESRIGMQVGTLRAAYGKCVLPTFIEAPENFLDLEQGPNMDLRPAPVNCYFGKPFTPRGTGATTGITDFVNTFRDSLATVGAPVERFQWGYMKRGKPGAETKRIQEFIPV